MNIRPLADRVVLKRLEAALQKEQEEAKKLGDIK